MLGRVLRVISAWKKQQPSVKRIRNQGFDFFPSLGNIIALKKTDEDWSWGPKFKSTNDVVQQLHLSKHPLGSFMLTSVPHAKLKVKMELINHHSYFLHYFIVSVIFHHRHWLNWQKIPDVKVCSLNSVMILLWFPKWQELLSLLLTENIFNVFLIQIAAK